MKYSVIICLALHVVLCNAYQRKIVIVTASYNNQRWYQRNLRSVFNQNYDNWHLMYIDAASPDGTGNAVEEFVAKSGKQDKVTLMKCSERKGPLENQFNAIHTCDPRAIIVILDGDDWLPNPDVLSYINHIYSDEKIWLTYGQFLEYPSYTTGFCCPMPIDVVKNNAFRQFTHIPSHMRTFYAGLFQRIKKEDLCDETDSFFTMAGDMAAMLPMIEMARDNFKFIDQEIYVYNAANVLNEHKVSKNLQQIIDRMIRKKPPYEPLEALFN
ncbi:glycosyltransferase [Candidatus Dependentiae bacterium]|nr:glycosyltransferase [Candidatus Dependentiae bacterium]